MSNRIKTPITRIAWNAAVLLFEKGIAAAASFVYIPYTVQAVGIATFGQILLVISYIEIISDLTSLLSWQTVLHYGAAPYREGRRADLYHVLRFGMRLDFLSGAVGYLIGEGGLWCLSSWLGWAGPLHPVMDICLLFVFFDKTGWCVGTVRLLNKFTYLTFGNGLTATFRILASMAGYYAHMGMTYFLYVWLLSSVVLFFSDMAATFYALRKYEPSRFGWRQILHTPAFLQGAWTFTIMASLNKILLAATKKLPILLIGGSLGPTEAAIYKVSDQVSNGLVRPMRTFMPALYPEFVHLREEGRMDDMHRVIRKLFLSAMLFACIALLVVTLFGDQVLHLLLGIHGESGYLLPVLVCGALLTILGLPLEPFIVVTGRLTALFRFQVLNVLANLPVLFVMVHFWGTMGAAYSLVLFSGTLLAFYAVYARAAFVKETGGRNGP
ncbi:lipopolysaccharide biosynthesis protein [Acetobacter papayae]|uniref:lipopolysaccharide biosynthesis protein n=1 Tax=Acetobacter papayae TaxID=1076592 RepID=UPI00046E6237|nr:hypothetical protein [Acetobacter papayae]